MLLSNTHKNKGGKIGKDSTRKHIQKPKGIRLKNKDTLNKNNKKKIMETNKEKTANKQPNINGNPTASQVPQEKPKEDGQLKGTGQEKAAENTVTPPMTYTGTQVFVYSTLSALAAGFLGYLFGNKRGQEKSNAINKKKIDKLEEELEYYYELEQERKNKKAKKDKGDIDKIEF